MKTIEISRFPQGEMVIHFGGQPASVDAYTFANALIAFADTVRAVNAVTRPEQEIEIRLEAVGPGSFRAAIKSINRGIAGLFRQAPNQLFWIVVGIFIQQSIEDPKSITISGDKVIISEGKDKIVISRDVFDRAEEVRKDENVQRNIRRTLQAIERDASVEDFGFTPTISDQEPLIRIPRSRFERILNPSTAIISSETRRSRSERAGLVVLKAWLSGNKRKWAFEWNGVPISAYVADAEFLAKVRNHQVRFGNGDIIEAEIEFAQNFDAERGVWLNDQSSYIVSRVIAFHPVGESIVLFK